MRASSLSNAKIIDLLNQYFIPAHADGVYYQKNVTVAPEEKKAYQRIFHELHQLNQKNKAEGKPLLSVGTVHAYVLTSDGKPFASLHVAEAGPEKVTAMLENAVETLKVAQGKPVANQDLWQELLPLALDPSRPVAFQWVKGHSGDRMNDVVDLQRHLHDPDVRQLRPDHRRA